MAVPQNSTFKYTDTGVTPFVVKPYSANGPMTPASSTLYSNPDGISAVSANTSLVFIGRGAPYYGEVVQANMVYMLEHFSNKTRPQFPTMGQIWHKKQDFTDPFFPSDPTTKGLYIWSGTVWDPIQMKGSTSPQLDLGGNRIVNMGDAVADMDAMNRRTSDTRYARITGSDLNGTFILLDGMFHADPGAILSCSDIPTADTHVVNLGYLNVVSDALTGMIDAVDQRIDNLEISGGVYATTSGATFTGNIVLTNLATIVAQSGGPAFDMNGRRITNLALTPLAQEEAASKQYVDDQDAVVLGAVATNTASIGTVQSDLLANYARKDGVTFSGNVVLANTSSLALVAGGTATFGGRTLQNIGTPAISTDAASKGYVDAIVTSARNTRRYVTTQTVGGTTSFTLPDSMVYTVDSNKLELYKQGIKQVAHTRGKSIVKVTGTNLSSLSDTGLAQSTLYSVTVTVDGGTPTPLSITTAAAATTFSGLVSALNAAAVTATLNVQFTVDVYSSTALEIVATSFTSGASSSIALSYAVGSLFYSITNSVAPVATAGAAYHYNEVGNTGTSSTSILFAVAPSVSDVLEFILTP